MVSPSRMTLPPPEAYTGHVALRLGLSKLVWTSVLELRRFCLLINVTSVPTQWKVWSPGQRAAARHRQSEFPKSPGTSFCLGSRS